MKVYFVIDIEVKNKIGFHCLGMCSYDRTRKAEIRQALLSQLVNLHPRKGRVSDNFRRGLHSFFVTGSKMHQLYKTSFNA
jgi:hypothetical protein